MVEWKNIGTVCSNVFAGGTPSTKNPEYYDGDIPWIRSGEIDFNIIRKAERNITETGYENSSAKKIRARSVVMAMTGATVAKTAVVDIETTANQSVCAMVTDNSIIDYRFLFYYLSENYFRIKSSAQGALTSLNLAMIKDIPVPIPSHSEQHRIVNILNTFTSAIDNLKQQIVLRKKQYDSCRNQLLDFKKREDLETKKLGELFTFKNGLNKGKEYFGKGKPIIMFTNVFNSRCINSSLVTGKVDITSEEQQRIDAKKGDVFFTRTSETKEDVGYASVLVEDIKDCTFAGFLIRARPITSLLLPSFCKYCFSTPEVRASIVSNSSFTTRASLTGGGLSKVTISIPSLAEQSTIVDKLDKFESIITNLDAQLRLRQKQYEYYRNKLLTFE